MSLSFLYWLLMVLWFVFGAIFVWPFGYSYGFVGGNLILFALLVLLGLQVFGSPIKRP